MNNNLNKMLLVNSNTVETYEYNVKYMVDIITNEEDGVYEAWFYFPDHGMKNEMDRFQIDKYTIGEMLWYLSGKPLLKEIQKYSKGWDRMTDDGVTVNSNYGYCIKHSGSGGPAGRS